MPTGKESLLLVGICAGMYSNWKPLCPAGFSLQQSRDYADYVYLRSDLATLSGKKFQAKRNHINKFKKRLIITNILRLQPTVSGSASIWKRNGAKANNCDQHEGTGNERRALIYALHNFDALGLTGGILHVEGKIAAFTFGMPIKSRHVRSTCRKRPIPA